jgi:hypothetical protein
LDIKNVPIGEKRMGRRQYEVSDETAYRWAERYRRGDSFRKIALDEKVERRVVARVVRRLDKAKHLNEIAAALRDVRAGFLREHLELLERVANILLELTAPPSLRDSEYVSYVNVKEQLLKEVETERNKDIAGLWLPLQSPTGEVVEKKEDAQRDFKLRLAKRRAKREAGVLVEDLKEHLPSLWSKVEEWEGAAKSCEVNLGEMAKLAKDKGISQNLFESGLKAGLNFLSKSKQQADLPRVPLKLETDSDVGVWLFRNGGTRESLELFRQNLGRLEAAYVQLEELLNPLELRKTLLARQCKHCPLT